MLPFICADSAHSLVVLSCWGCWRWGVSLQLLVLRSLLLSKTALIVQEVVGRGGRGGRVVLGAMTGVGDRGVGLISTPAPGEDVRGGESGLASACTFSVVVCLRPRHLPYLAQIGQGFVVGVVGPVLIVVGAEVMVMVVGVVVAAKVADEVVAVFVKVVVASCLFREKYRASSDSGTGVGGGA